MESLSLKMLDVLSNQIFDVRFAEHDKMVQALDLDRLIPALHKGVHVR